MDVQTNIVNEIWRMTMDSYVPAEICSVSLCFNLRNNYIISQIENTSLLDSPLAKEIAPKIKSRHNLFERIMYNYIWIIGWNLVLFLFSARVYSTLTTIFSEHRINALIFHRE